MFSGGMSQRERDEPISFIVAVSEPVDGSLLAQDAEDYESELLTIERDEHKADL